MVRLVNLVLPPGWLPLGIRGLAEGNVLPALLGTLGLTLIGSASLRRAYRTTLRLYTGQFSSGKARRRGPKPGSSPRQRRLRCPRRAPPASWKRTSLGSPNRRPRLPWQLCGR